MPHSESTLGAYSAGQLDDRISATGPMIAAEIPQASAGQPPSSQQTSITASSEIRTVAGCSGRRGRVS